MTDGAKKYPLAESAIREDAKIIEAELGELYTDRTDIIGGLEEAQSYSLLRGGKRIRPALCIEVCRMLGGNTEAALPFAVAIELVHNYSLIHDDLPCMDNDELRRGKPTTHIAYGEAVAVLAGDGLLTDAFLECAMNSHVSGDCAAAAVSVLSAAAGSKGMIRGQAIDLYGEAHTLSLEQLIDLHSGKTGALICASVQLGALAAGVHPNSETMNSLTEYASLVGLAFQIVDDVLDATSTTDSLGKPVGSDREQNKTTFMSFFAPEQASEYARECTARAVSIASNFSGGEVLAEIAEYLCDRKS